MTPAAGRRREGLGLFTRPGNDPWRSQSGMYSRSWITLSLMGFVTKANILVNQTGHACLADFGLLTIASDTNITSSNSFLQGGTWRWMSPEFFDPGKFKLKDNRPTKHSDCYALGMVIYEVLSGRVPFSRHHGLAIIGRIIEGERPRRPRGEEVVWFTDDIWSILERCWKPTPGDRPSIKDVLRCLENVSMFWTPPTPQTIVGPPTTNSPIRSSDPSSEESTDEGGASSPSQAASPQISQKVPPKGDPNENSICSSAHEFSALLHDSLSQSHPSPGDRLLRRRQFVTPDVVDAHQTQEDEKTADDEVWKPNDPTLGGVPEKVCGLPGLTDVVCH